jgi:prevent-host-death family protein
MCYMASPTAARNRPVPATHGSRRPKAPGSSVRKVKMATPQKPKVADETATTVGVRELRQNLSVYLDRVKQGEAFQVTEHGRIVAVLTALPPTASRYDLLLAQGLITPATKAIRDLPPPRRLAPGARPMSEILDELREDRF